MRANSRKTKTNFRKMRGRMKTYNPNPLDTSAIELSPELLELTEQIAENVHDVWSTGRIAEGWTYGETRDDKLKQTPCLVPYSELPESEKEFDRKTTLNTLKFVIALGYKIEKVE